MEALQAVIFDLDGVLTDTSKFHAQAWGDLARSVGAKPPADLEEQVKGISRMASLRIALGAAAEKYTPAQLEELATRKNDCYLKAVEGVSPADLFPGVLDLFKALKAAKIRIALGSASRNARIVLERLGLTAWFDAIADGFAYSHGKPHPDVFRSAARLMGVPTSACIVVEDAAAGISSALDGGFVTLGMGHEPSLRHAHAFVPALTAVSVASLRDLHRRWYVPHWSVVREGVHGDWQEASLHTLFCVGNGAIGVRGYSSLLPRWSSGTYIAGYYDTIRRPKHEPENWPPFLKYWGNPELARDVQIEAALVNCPDLLDLQLAFAGANVDLASGRMRSMRRTLDLRSGIFTTEADWISPAGHELRITTRRLADMARRDRVIQRVEVEAVNCAGELTIRAGLNCEAANGADLGRQRIYDLVQRKQPSERAQALLLRGVTGGAEAAVATELAVEGSGVTYAAYRDNGRFGSAATVKLADGGLVCFEQRAVFTTWRQAKDPLAAAVAALGTATQSFHEARIDHTARWQRLWIDSDVVIEGNVPDQLGIRFSIYHLLIAASADDAGVSIPAKSLSGDGYRGMVFWDTDIHMTPFFVFTQPELARNLAMFRHRTLAGARAKAAKYGFKGASYPWETGVSGDEECEKWLKLITHQSHITADVAHFLDQYVSASGDMEFYAGSAAEVFLETARFWVSKAVDDGKGVSIPDAGGPDEFHVVGHDSAFVNHLAIFNLDCANRAIAWLQANRPKRWQELKAATGVSDAELQKIATYPKRIRPMQVADGRFEQCRGFFKLEDTVLHDEKKGAPQDTQTVKQADVLMLLYLLPDAWSREVLQANWDYYEPRCVHASSLSHGVHGILAAELGVADKAQKYIRASLGMDLRDEMGNTSAGAHMAANGMSWSGVVRGFAGCRPQGDHFLIEPRLPADWQRVAFSIKWRGAAFSVDIGTDGVVVSNRSGATAALPCRVLGRQLTVKPGERIEVRQDSGLHAAANAANRATPTKELPMAIEKTVKREGKKAPVLSMKEKRAAKAAKRASK